MSRSAKRLTAKLGQEVAQILREPRIADVIHKQGMEVGGGTPEAFAVVLQAESARYAALVKQINFTID